MTLSFSVVSCICLCSFLKFLFVAHFPGRGGDHAYWPSDANLIDRSSINGNTHIHTHAYTHTHTYAHFSSARPKLTVRSEITFRVILGLFTVAVGAECVWRTLCRIIRLSQRLSVVLFDHCAQPCLNPVKLLCVLQRS